MTFSIGMSENGWTDDFLCTKWFEESFIPQATARNDSGIPILLIYDGHGSHTTDEMHTLAKKHNIEIGQQFWQDGNLPEPGRSARAAQHDREKPGVQQAAE